MRIYVLIPFSYNEEKIVEKNIRHLTKFRNVKIFIVGPREIPATSVFFIKEKRRMGKAYWIKRILLKKKSGISILISGDVSIGKDFIRGVLRNFEKKDVGMVCFKVRPKVFKSFIGKLYEAVWVLNDALSRFRPKGGEAIAFRNGIVKKFHEKVVADEAYIEANVVLSGYDVVYESKICVKNYSPRSLSEFFSQRVRYHIGHLQVKKETGYKVASLNYKLLLLSLFNVFFTRRDLFFAFLLLLPIESIARVYAHLLFVLNRLPYKWRIAKSSRVAGRR